MNTDKNDIHKFLFSSKVGCVLIWQLVTQSNGYKQEFSIAVLSLCDDVTQKPESPDIFLCGVWALEVLDSNAAVSCDYYDHWIYVL